MTDKIDVSQAVEVGKQIGGDRLRKEYDARAGRMEDELVDAGLPNQIFARLDGSDEATRVYYPTGFDITTLEYDAPLKVKRQRGQFVVVSTDAIVGADYWGGSPPINSTNFAPVILQTAFSSFPVAQVLGSLASGYLKNTTTTGVLSVQVVPIPVSDGGSGAVSFTANRILLGNGTGAFGTITTGASGTYLRSNGTVGSFATLNMGDAGAGTLVVARGGTGLTAITSGNIPIGAGTSPMTLLAPGASGNLVTSNGTTFTSTAPSFNASVISAGTLDNARINWASPGTIGSTTPNTGVFSLLTATRDWGSPSATNIIASFDSYGDILAPQGRRHCESASRWGALLTRVRVF